MQRDLDLIRNIMLQVEATGPGKCIQFSADIPMPTPGDATCPEIPDNEKNAMVYNAAKLVEADLLDGRIVPSSHNLPHDVMIMDLTNEGHDFVEAIRNDTNWNHLKENVAKVGGWTIRTIVSAAITAMTNRLAQ